MMLLYKATYRGNFLKLRLFIFLFAIFLAFNLSLPVLAEGEIKLGVTPGYDGEYKKTEWVPVKIAITNNSSRDIEGVVSIKATGSYESQATYYENVTIAKNTTKNVTLLVPGQGLNSQNIVIFQEGDKELARAKVGGTAYSELFSIGILASDKSTGNFISLPNNYQLAKDIVYLSSENFYNSSLYLKGLDMIVINNYSFDNFNSEQIQSIVDWTEEGGKLVLAGGTYYNKIADEITALSPVQVNGLTELSKLTNLEKEVNKPINLQEPMTMSNSSVKNGRVLIEEEDVPIFVLGDAKAGKVLYVAYDIAEEPLASWSGNKELWSNILSEFRIDYKQQNIYHSDNFWQLQNASQRIPSLELPELNKIIIIFLIYMLLIGPILYFILKRKDKREKAWIIIPIFAILITIGFYQYGHLNRGSQVISHNVSYMELNDNGQGKVKAVSSIFAPKIGDYNIQYNNVDMLQSINNTYNRQSNTDDTWIQVNNNSANVLYKDVDFWSLKNTYIESTIQDTGSFESSLSYKDGRLTGTITNNTKYSLRDIKLVVGSSVKDIGDLAKNESANIDISYSPKNSFNGSGYYQVDRLLPNNLQNNPNTYNNRERYILEMLNYNNNSFATDLVVIGWTEENIIDFDIHDRKHKDYDLTLVKGSLKTISDSDGNVYLTPNNFKTQLIGNSVNVDYFEDGYHFFPGSLFFEIDLVNIDYEIEYEKIYFHIFSRDGIILNNRIYNWQNNTYESLKEAAPNDYLTVENIDKYLSPEGKIRLEISHNYESRSIHLGLPTISAEGRVIGK